MEENQIENSTNAERQRESDEVTLLDSNQMFSEPSTSRQWLKTKWGEIATNVHNHTDILSDSLREETGCCDFLRCWNRGDEPVQERVIYGQYIPAVQCDKDNLCRYCRIIRRQQLTDKRRQLEVVLKLYEKQLKLLNQKEKELIEKKRPSIFRRWGSVFKFSGSTDTINSVKQLPETSAIME